MDPSRLGPYTIRGRLGRGGMGTVYEAVDPHGAFVAVKTLRGHVRDQAGSRRRFDAEIAALKELRHPGIVRLLAFGEEDDQPFFAMELVRGKSLEELLRAGRRFSWQETVATALQVTRALKAAHDHGIVHRDLKPANLLFPDDAGPEAGVKLADFGIARLFGESGQTQAGTVVGTAEYMAPEQAAGEPVDQRVDLYALGLVMYAMLVGRPPFTGADMASVLRRQRRETPPRVSSFVPDVPEQLDLLVEKLLAKHPAGRPASALAVGRMLAAIGEAPPPAVSDHAGEAAESGSAGNTATDRPPRPTQPLRQQPASDRDVDLLAATVDGGGRVPLGETRDSSGPGDRPATVPPTAAAAGSLVHRRTAADVIDTRPERAAGTRFTTLEELHRRAREDATRTARRETVAGFGLASALLAAVLAGGYVLLRPATSDELHARIRAVADAPDADLRDARHLIDLFLTRFPADPRAEGVRDLDHTLAVEALERRTRRRPRSDTELTQVERDYRAAMAREAESPLACRAALEAMLALHNPDRNAGNGSLADEAEEADLWLALIRKQIDRLGPLADRERAEDRDRATATLAEAAELADAATAAPAAERAALLGRRRDLLEGLIEIYASRPHMAEPVAEARRLLAPPAP